MRGAADNNFHFHLTSSFLLTRLMRGAANSPRGRSYAYNISTHAPHARLGADADLIGSEAWEFLLTRLMRGAAFWQG